MEPLRSLYFPYVALNLHNVRTMSSLGDSLNPPAQGLPCRSAEEMAREAGLYDPRHESDACGVGFVVHMKGKRSHDIVRNALQVLINLEHRGACGCEANTGDGAGILMQTPDRFFRKVVPFTLPAEGSYAASLVFLPHDSRDRDTIKDLI